MSRIFIDGFETGVGLWDINGGSIIGTPGAYSLRLGNSEHVKIIPASTIVCIGFDLTVASTATLRVKFYTGTDLQGQVTVNGLFTSGVVTNDDESDSSGWSQSGGSSAHFQVKFENINNTEKRFILEINGIQKLDYTVTNVTPDQTTTSKIIFDPYGAGGLGPVIDNVVIDDADLNMYGADIVAILPTADSSPIDWTPSSGESHYPLVNTPNGTTAWIQSNIQSDADLFEMSNVSIGDQNIKAVQLQAWGARESSSGEIYQCILKVSGETYYGASGESIIVQGFAKTIWGNNPATSSEWTMPDVQSIEAGVVIM